MRENKRKANREKTLRRSIKKHQFGVVGVAVTAMVFFSKGEVNIHALESGETATVIASEINNTSNNETGLANSGRASVESARSGLVSNMNNTNNASNSNDEKTEESSISSVELTSEARDGGRLASSPETATSTG